MVLTLRSGLCLEESLTFQSVFDDSASLEIDVFPLLMKKWVGGGWHYSVKLPGKNE